MNIERLLEAQAEFLQVYPLGFDDPGIAAIRKKHNVPKLAAFAAEHLSRAHVGNPRAVVNAAATIIARSSMVSRFEKPPFRAFIDAMSSADQDAFAAAMAQRLYGNRRKGFEALVEMLAPHKIAKWAVVSAIPFYVAPKREAFVKPTTAKGIVKLLEASDLVYRPRPDWAFYSGYRDLLAQVRRHVDPSLAPSTAALSGFLMMSFQADSATPASGSV